MLERHPVNPSKHLVASFLAYFALAEAEIKAAPARPNIIVILADDMGFSDIGCYGSEIPTPNIDRIANEGVRLSQFYNVGRCCPTRASLLTGLYPHQAGIGHMVDDYAIKAREKLNSPAYTAKLNDRCITIGEALSSAGYETMMSGKWHLGFAPERDPSHYGFAQAFTMMLAMVGIAVPASLNVSQRA